MRSICEPLPRPFFDRCPSQVAPALLGCWLVRRGPAGEVRARIVETEAYLGAGDEAAHAACGLTARNAVLFGPPGHAYIYRIYGLYWCLNVSTLPAGQAGGVLFRALEAVSGPPVPSLSGPGRLTRALAIDHGFNAADLTRPGPLYLARGPRAAGPIAVTARVGIRKSARLPLRFFLLDSAAVSAPRGPVLARIASAAECYTPAYNHGD